jgi:hypothetical protein
VPVSATPDFDHDADTLDRAGYRVVFEEHFTAPALAADRWVAHYLPHWGTPERPAARYALDARVLTLRIDADQPPWLPEEELRVSNIQAGSLSGPVGSDCSSSPPDQFRDPAVYPKPGQVASVRGYRPTAGHR